MTIVQSRLPYAKDALEPHISARTLSYHYDKHHRAYIDKLNKKIAGTPFEQLSLEEIIPAARSKGETDIFNNAAQAFNHTFFWESMSPNGDSTPEGRIAEMIESDFGDLEGFKTRFRKEAVSLFGSGWIWLVQDGAKLRILPTGNAETPIGMHMLPLLTIDVWEHAYYLDYQNERGRYIDTFLDKLINWKFAAAKLVDLRKSKAA